MTNAAVQMMIPSAALAKIGSRRQPCELAHDEFQIAFDGGEVGSRLIGLPSRIASRQGPFARSRYVLLTTPSFARSPSVSVWRSL